MEPSNPDNHSNPNSLALKPTKTILVILPSLYGGGAEGVMLTLLEHLDRTRFTPTLLVLSNQGHLSVRARNLRNLGLSLVVFGSGPKPLSLLRCWIHIWTHKPDLILSSMGPVNALLSLVTWALPAKSRLILRETNIPSLLNTIKIRQGKPIYHLINLLYHTSYRWVHRIIAQSLAMKQDLTTTYNIPEWKIVPIPNPIDPNRIAQAKTGPGFSWPEPCTYEEIGETANPIRQVRLLALGRLSYEKGFDLLLHRLAEVNHLPFSLCILGEGPEEPTLRGLIRTYGLEHQVHLLGFVPNPLPALAAAQVFLLPSRSEGFPNVVLESLALGTPVIASLGPGGHQEMIRPGINGYLVDYTKPQALVSVIQQAQALKPLNHQVVNQFTQTYGITQIMNQYQNLFERTC